MQSREMLLWGTSLSDIVGVFLNLKIRSNSIYCLIFNSPRLTIQEGPISNDSFLNLVIYELDKLRVYNLNNLI